jgi:4'-phosphopantetheinyl transferase
VRAHRYDGTRDRARRVVTDDVEVAWVDLDPGEAAVRELETLLSTSDRSRVARRATPALRRRAIVSIGARRRLAGHVLGVAPAAVQLQVAADGRRQATAPGAATVSLSVSDCDETGLVVVSAGHVVGCDVEDDHELPATDVFVAHVTTRAERRRLDGLRAEDRERALLRLWTRKEAYLKAIGAGIGTGLARVEVPLEAGLEGVPWWPDVDGSAWFLFDLACPRPGLAATVVVSASGARAAPPGLRVRRAA